MSEQIRCEECEGRGWIETNVWTGWQFDGGREECPACKGAGEVEKPDFSEDELEELAECGVEKPRILHREYENICCHLHIEAEVDGVLMYGVWIDGDGAGDIKWTAQPVQNGG